MIDGTRSVKLLLFEMQACGFLLRPTKDLRPISWNTDELIIQIS